MRLSFTGTLRVIRRALPKFQRLQPQQLPFFLNWLTLEILDQILPKRVHTSNPWVVKKPVSKFRSKKVKHRGTGTKTIPPVFVVLSTA